MSWWQLKTIADDNRISNQQYMQERPTACPYCGTPLVAGWHSTAGGGREYILDCPMGDYSNRGEPRLT